MRPGGNVTIFEDMSDDEIKAHVAERLPEIYDRREVHREKTI
jgi:hypothetical protein